ncbi:MAG: chromosomal replication initiator protein DnaA [Clostridia bacterium]|nr:chromosomal replication initiator protein DnaA [Clostridia bacterium]
MAESSQLQFMWKQICEQAVKTISPISYNHFFENKGIEPIDIRGRKIVLRFTTEQNAESFLVHKIGDKLREAIVKCDNGLTDFHVYVEGSDTFKLDEEDGAEDAFQASPINKSFTFDSFVVGPGTKFAYAAAKAVAEDPGQTLNPLFIYGESGLGKTHLMQAIANHLAEHSPEKKVLYTTSENFLNGFIDSLTQKAGATRFRLHYRNVDVLMIDDIQFLKGKTQMQEAFFHTFNELSAQNKQIVLTSDRPPKEIATLEDRLRTRFEGGMIVDIQPPTVETKIAILKRKALDKKCCLPQDVLEFLANNTSNDVRALEGRLTKVIFASKLHEEPITLQLARLALNESVDETETQEDITPEKIVSSVCAYFKQSKADLIGKSKKADIVKARQICAYLLCDMLSLPLDFIGKEILGGRDHTTIMYARDKMEKLANLNERIAKEIDDIKNIVLKK